MKNKKGITLIALVITIIVLLILAGVTVATLTGENGLLSKAQLAKERNIEAEQDERNKLSSYEDEIDNNMESSRNVTLQRTVLWDGNGENKTAISATGAEASWTNSIEDYKFIVIETKYDNSPAALCTWLDVETIKQTGYNTNKTRNSNFYHGIICIYDNFYTFISFTSDKSLMMDCTSKISITKIMGIN